VISRFTLFADWQPAEIALYLTRKKHREWSNLSFRELSQTFVDKYSAWEHLMEKQKRAASAKKRKSTQKWVLFRIGMKGLPSPNNYLT
jgi:hypothetical protein